MTCVVCSAGSRLKREDWPFTPPGGIQRPRGQLPGGSGYGLLIVAQLGGQGFSDFRHASRVSCSELLCVRERQAGGRSATVPHSQTPGAASAARRRLASQAGPLGRPPDSLHLPHLTGATHANSTWQATPLSIEPCPGWPGHPHVNPSPPLRSLAGTPAAHLPTLTGKDSSPRPSPARLINTDRDGGPQTGALASIGPVSMLCGGERRITASSSAARRPRLRYPHSTATRQARQPPTFRTPAGSAAASCYAAPRCHSSAARWAVASSSTQSSSSHTMPFLPGTLRVGPGWCRGHDLGP